MGERLRESERTSERTRKRTPCLAGVEGGALPLKVADSDVEHPMKPTLPALPFYNIITLLKAHDGSCSPRCPVL